MREPTHDVLALEPRTFDARKAAAATVIRLSMSGKTHGRKVVSQAVEQKDI
jgi:hypothetical protein